MRIDFMRKVERHAGKAILQLLRLWLLVARPCGRLLAWLLPSIFSGRRQDGHLPETVRTIFVQKYFGMGSIFCAIPLLEYLRQRYPDARLIFMTFASNRQFLEHIDKVDEILTVDSKAFFPFMRDNIRNLFRLRARKVDISIDLEFFTNYSMLVSYLSGAPARSGFCAFHSLRCNLITHPTPLNHYKHISRVFLATAQSLGLDAPEEVGDIRLPQPPEEAKRGLASKLARRGSGPLIVINPNSSDLCQMRRWPDANFVALLEALPTMFPEAAFVLIGASREKPLVDAIAAQCRAAGDRLINLAGKTSLLELLALLQACDLLITNDSGPAHLAAGYHTPTVVLFGPETPTLYKPVNPNARVFWKELYCSPCINVLDNKNFELCTEVACMRAIGVEEVLREVEAMMPVAARAKAAGGAA